MLKLADLHDYQRTAERFLRERPGAALWLDMGLGKTVSVLTAFVNMQLLSEMDCLVIVGPIRVIQTVWETEAAKWAHTKHLRFSLVHGSARHRLSALRAPADVYLINYENLLWLRQVVRQHKLFPKGQVALTLDESSKIKAHNTKRFRMLKGIRSRFKAVWELTGTPAPKGYLNIWSQILMLDGGARFGTRYDLFREEFFRKLDYNGYNYGIRRGAQQRIERLIAPVVLRLDSRDCKKELPAVVHNEIWMDMPPALMRQYQRLEDDMFLRLEEAEKEIEVLNAAALSAKCWQFANGALYDDEKTWHAIHDLKLDALEDIFEEAGESPVLVAYWFQADLQRLKERFGGKQKKLHVFSEAKDMKGLIAEWGKGNIDKLFIHPASGGYGIDGLQVGGHQLAFFSQTWSLEMYDQLIARLNRQGQTSVVTAQHLLIRNTTDVAMRAALHSNATTQRQLLDALRRYRMRHIT